MIQIVRDNPKPAGSQAEAITNLNNDLLISAGAGSGKTWVLAERYLEILSKDYRPNEIVAITFTKKAAGEMKGRIRKAIQKMAQLSEAEEEKRYWERCDQEFNHTIITTIDGFCTEILRANPLEAGLSPDFKVLDATEAEILKKQLFTDTVRQYIESPANKEKAVVLYENFGSINAIVSNALKVTNQLNTHCKNADEVLQLTQQKMLEYQNENYEPCFDRLENSVEKIAEWLDGNGQNKSDYVSKMKLWLTKYKETRELIQTCPEVIDDEFISSLLELQDAIWPKQGNADIKARREELVSDLGQFYKCLYPLRYQYLMQALIDVIRIGQKRYSKIKLDQQAVDFHDLETLTLRVLEKGEVRQKWQSRIQFIMVDEFQDTNKLQKNIIDLFSDRGNKMKVFVVGDGKQSIYKFRGADIQVFYEIAEEIKGRGKEPLSLNMNFRTQEGIIHYINSLFEQIMVRRDGDPSYFTSFEGLKAHRKDKQENMLELLCAGYKQEIMGDSEDEPTDSEPDADQEELLELKNVELEADLIARRIVQMKGKESVVWKQDTDKKDGQESPVPVDYKDFAVLLSARTSLNVYEVALQKYNIPYIVVGGRDYYRKQEVLDVINLLRMLENAEDNVALLGFLRSPLAQISDITLFKMTRKQSLQEALFYLEEKEWQAQGWDFDHKEWSRWVKVRQWIQTWRQTKKRDSAYSLIKRILQDTGYMTMLLGTPQGEQRAANVEKFLRITHGLVEQKGYNLYDVLQYFELLQEEEVQEQEEEIADRGNAVVIMSVHASKGLDFPVVFIPEINKDILKQSRFHSESVFYQPEIGLGVKMKGYGSHAPGTVILDMLKEDEKSRIEQEAKRLLYVAMTRVRDHLILVTSKEKRKSKNPQAAKRLSWGQMILNHFGWSSLDECMNQQIVKGQTGDGDAWQLKISKDYEVIADTEAQEVSLNEEVSELKFPLMEYRWEPDPCAVPQHLPKLSASALKLYLDCPRTFYLRYIQGIYGLEELTAIRGTASEQQILSASDKGTIVHNLLENLTLSKLQQEDWTHTVEQEVLQLLDESAPSSQVVEIVEDIARYLKTYEEFLHDLGDSGSFEDEKSFTMLWGNQSVVGKIDRIHYHQDGTVSIYDFKTNKKAGSVQKMVQPYQLQGYLYTEIVEKVLGKSVQNMTFVFLDSGENYQLPLDPESRAAYNAKITKIINELEKQVSIQDYPCCQRNGCVCRYFDSETIK